MLFNFIQWCRTSYGKEIGPQSVTEGTKEDRRKEGQTDRHPNDYKPPLPKWGIRNLLKTQKELLIPMH